LQGAILLMLQCAKASDRKEMRVCFNP